MKKRLRLLGFVLLVIGMVALVAACGGTTTTGGGSTESTAPAGSGTSGTAQTTAPATGGDQVAIGFMTSYTGEMGAYGVPWFNAGKMAVDDINAAGGVLDKKVVLFTEDDRSSVEEGIKAARKLIGTNGVVAIAGPISDVCVGVYPICKDNKVMLSSEAAGTTRMDTGYGDWFFRTCPSDSFDGKVAAQVMIENGYKEIAVMYENDEGRKSIAGAVVKEFEALGGKVLTQIPFSPRQTTYSAELQKVAQVKPQIVWLGSGQDSAPVLLKNASQAGYQWKWMVSSDIAVPELFNLVGASILEGVLSETPSADVETEAFKAWAERFQTLFNAEPTGAFQSNSYDQVIIHALAMQKGGAATGEAISKNYRDVCNAPGTKVYSYSEALAALKAGQDIDYDGVSGPCDMDENGNTVASYTSLMAKNGKWEVTKFYPAETFLEQ